MLWSSSKKKRMREQERGGRTEIGRKKEIREVRKGDKQRGREQAPMSAPLSRPIGCHSFCNIASILLFDHMLILRLHKFGFILLKRA